MSERRLYRWRRIRVRIDIDQAAPDAAAIEHEIGMFLARNFDVVHDRRRWLVLARRARRVAVGGSVPADPEGTA